MPGRLHFIKGLSGEGDGFSVAILRQLRYNGSMKSSTEKGVMSALMRKTKIICTLGPASSDETTLRRMMEAGMDVARFNFSHGTHAEHLERYRLVDRLREELALPIGTMLDTKGPEIRLGVFENGAVMLRPGEPFTLTPRDVTGTETCAHITYGELGKDLTPGSRVLIDDGLIELIVDSVDSAGEIHCTVRSGGRVSDRKGVNVPGVHLSLPFLSEADQSDLLFGIETGFDFVAASFVRTADDVREMRRFLEEHGGRRMKIISKIENAEGVEHIDEILRVSDGVMVARGDMGVEIPLEDVPVHQKDLIKKAYMAGKHVITATQMLESMSTNPRPTRAEANDVANAIYDGTSAIMLSGESAAGRYPVEAVATMARIARRIEQDIDYRHRFYSRDYHPSDVTNAISHATCTTAYDLNAAAIISITQSGQTARMCSRFRPGVPIIACTTSKGVFRQLSLAWGVTPIIMQMKTSTDELFDAAVEAAMREGLCRDGDLVVLTAGIPLGIPGTTNLLKVAVAGYSLVRGRGLNSHKVVGNLCVAKNAQEALQKFKQNDILVIPAIGKPLLDLLGKASGLITESDELDFDAEEITRSIPVIVGARDATRILRGGISVGVDASQGLVYNAASRNNSEFKGEE